MSSVVPITFVLTYILIKAVFFRIVVKLVVYGSDGDLFYGSFHHNTVNKLIYIICIPIILTTSLEIIERVAPGWVLSVLAIFHSVSYIFMDSPTGAACPPIIGAMD